MMDTFLFVVVFIWGFSVAMALHQWLDPVCNAAIR